MREQTTCVRHEKLLSKALLMYAEEHDGSLPPASNWANAILPYVQDRGAFVCPEARNKQCSYAFNQALSSVRAADIYDRNYLVMLFESDLGWNGSGDAARLPTTPRHLGQDVFVFADGHVNGYHRDDWSRMGIVRHDKSSEPALVE